MFKKIHSNLNKGQSDADVQPTVFSELRRELSVYIDSVVGLIIALLKKYPKPAFGLMVFLMLGSMFLSFTVFRRSESKKVSPNVKSAAQPLSQGFGQIMKKGADLEQLIRIKTEIELLLGKDSLSGRDSLQLSAALDSLHELSIRSPQ